MQAEFILDFLHKKAFKTSENHQRSYNKNFFDFRKIIYLATLSILASLEQLVIKMPLRVKDPTYHMQIRKIKRVKAGNSVLLTYSFYEASRP
jgi:hypothetical protein